MIIPDIIEKKRDGKELTREEIEFIVMGYVKNNIPPEQVSAWLMAITLRGMSQKEIFYLTEIILNSGKSINLSRFPSTHIDKHSTGGVGDKVSLLLAPMFASAGLVVLKMSGRGLGITGGTLDKLESIPGFRVNYSIDEIYELIEKTGVCLVGQSPDLTPADKKLYALRDVTGTIPSIPLIASSIMSKKLAGGSEHILIDLKVGVGSFINDIKMANELAETMINIGTSAGRKIKIVITDMNQPLGYAVGNALEIKETITALSSPDKANPRLIELCKYLFAQGMLLSKKTKCLEEGIELANNILSSGKALNKFREIVKSQNGDEAIFDNMDLLPTAPAIAEIKATKSGYINKIDAYKIGKIAIKLGAGRQTKEDAVDPSVGIVFIHTVGNYVKDGDSIAEIHAKNSADIAWAEKELSEAININDTKPTTSDLIIAVVE